MTRVSCAGYWLQCGKRLQVTELALGSRHEGALRVCLAKVSLQWCPSLPDSPEEARNRIAVRPVFSMSCYSDCNQAVQAVWRR